MRPYVDGVWDALHTFIAFRQNNRLRSSRRQRNLSPTGPGSPAIGIGTRALDPRFNHLRHR